jgi:hypothetical protein
LMSTLSSKFSKATSTPVKIMYPSICLSMMEVSIAPFIVMDYFLPNNGSYGCLKLVNPFFCKMKLRHCLWHCFSLMWRGSLDGYNLNCTQVFYNILCKWPQWERHLGRHRYKGTVILK